MQGQPITVYCDNIEAYSRSGRHNLGEVLADGSQCCPLAIIDRCKGSPESAAVAALDLDDDERASVKRDQIGLAERRPVVPGEDAVAPALQKRGRDCFTPVPLALRAHAVPLRRRRARTRVRAANRVRATTRCGGARWDHVV